MCFSVGECSFPKSSKTCVVLNILWRLSVMACAYAALTGPKKHRHTFIHLHSFLLGSHLRGLSQQKGCKGISCWSPPLPGLGALCVCVCFTLASALSSVMVTLFHCGHTLREVHANQTEERYTVLPSWGSSQLGPGFPPNLSLTMDFLLLPFQLVHTCLHDHHCT